MKSDAPQMVRCSLERPALKSRVLASDSGTRAEPVIMRTATCSDPSAVSGTHNFPNPFHQMSTELKSEAADVSLVLDARARQVLNAIDDGVYCLDPQGNTIFVNEAA